MASNPDAHTDGQRRDLADAALTDEVVDSFSATEDKRFAQVMQSLVSHLHAFCSEVELTEQEWLQAIDFLTKTGHITDDKRQEFVLLSDVLGISMLVVGINNNRHSTPASEATVLGPFFVEGSPRFSNGSDISRLDEGEPCFVQGRVLSVDGSPVAGARVEVWQADAHGLYDVQYADASRTDGRGHLYCDNDGHFWFWTVMPRGYSIPDDGPVGDLLRTASRSPMRPAHIHFMISAPGYQTLTTHLFSHGDQYLDSDAVFGVKNSLITDFKRHVPGRAPDGRNMTAAFYVMSYDFELAESR
jgi:hydroxyquinol 1,2-dioxygenase